MVKLPDVVPKAMAKKLKWIEAVEIAGMSVRNMQRKRQASIEHGYDRAVRPVARKVQHPRVPIESAERVLTLYWDQ